MWPGSSVSGLYLAHPEAYYFGVAKVERDQVEDYARRKGMSIPEVERWLGRSSTTTRRGTWRWRRSSEGGICGKTSVLRGLRWPA
jgi:hypothetical protein